MAGLVFLAVFLGGFKSVSAWMGEQLSGVIVTDTPAEPSPTKPAKPERRQGDGKAKKER